MATASLGNIDNGLEKLVVVDSANESTDAKISEDNGQKWGFPLEEAYKLALTFFKEKEGKAVQLTYQTKLLLVAYSKQAAFGKFSEDIAPDVGFLDVVGNDRKQAWQDLGDMSKEEAMAEFVQKMTDSCSLFQPYLEAHKADKEEAERKLKEERSLEKGEPLTEKEALEVSRQAQEADKKRQQDKQAQIRVALNQQTQEQFRNYAEQQYPNDKTMQDDLIKQLQDQHFQQYMQQVYQQQQVLQQQQQQQATSSSPSITLNGITTTSSTDSGKVNASPIPDGVTPIAPCGDDEEEYSLAAASMWTRKDMKEFKDSLVKDKESVIKVGSGETVTVRVPTHEDGTCLFWEFATDYYDIGFGVYFEWTISQTNTVSVHVSESSDEEDEEEEAAKTEENKGGDVEKGPSKKTENKPPTDEIIPVYRRDCHEEVYCGSHTYPGQGVYLLKFDNSYSLWRSKTLYYRVYYSR